DPHPAEAGRPRPAFRDDEAGARSPRAAPGSANEPGRPGEAAEVKIHFIGIGGIGMSGLAKILTVRGDGVSGSDQAACEFPGAKVGHAAENLPEGDELVVRSAAIKHDNVEVVEARKRKIPVLKYAEMLGRLSKDKA